VAVSVGEDLAAHIRQQLSALQPGESTSFPTTFTTTQRKLVHMIASELHLQSYSEGKGEDRHVEVFNLTDFCKQVRETLSALEPGQQYDFPPSLSEKQRKLVHCIAQELGLTHASMGEGEKRFVAVASLRDFRHQFDAILHALPPGGSHAFDPSLTALQRKVIHEYASELGLSSESHGKSGERFVTVMRPVDPETQAQCVHEDEDDAASVVDESEENGEKTEENLISEVFDAYASGHHAGHKLFVCALDLGAVLKDLAETMPEKKKLILKLKKRLACIYEDTIDMQVDFGFRSRKGLNKKWFQVFIHKIAREMGFSTMCLLMGLMNEIDDD
jgi:predicted RNA-binding protein Jag